MREFHEELEYDLLRIGVDLLDFWRGTLTARRLWVLIRHLPLDSEFVKAAAPDAAEMGRWSATDYILADHFDLTAQAAFKDPKPYPRPSAVIEKRTTDEARRAALIAKYEARQKGAT